MKVKLYLAFAIFLPATLFAQIPEEALRLSWNIPQGTARYQAIGGAMTGLGGDASANFTNPAGLALFKTSDLLFTPGFKFGKNRSSFRGTSAKGDKLNGFLLGTNGLILGPNSGRGATIGITVTQVADLNQQYYYSGRNDYSSFGEPLADEFAASGLTIDQALNNNNISLQTKMALYTYLVDTARVNGNLQVISRSENTGIRNQEQWIETSGGIYELTLGVGGEISRKLLAGASLGIDLINSDKYSYYRETDASGDTDNDFNYLSYREDISYKGVGANLKLGLLYRPQDYFRLGFAVHTPSMMMLTEKVNSGLAADLENHFGAGNGYDSVSSTVFTGASGGEYKYTLNSPWKLMLGGSYVFREVSDVTRQKGFVTLDLEYQNFKWMNYGPYDETETKDAYTPFNRAIDAIYRGVFNARLGGELKFNTIMARAGFAYYSSPYKQKEIKAHKMNISAGLGYRHKGMFVDLTYVHRLNKDAHFPYRVNAPRSNTFATLRENGGAVMLTLGFKI